MTTSQQKHANSFRYCSSPFWWKCEIAALENELFVSQAGHFLPLSGQVYYSPKSELKAFWEVSLTKPSFLGLRLWKKLPSSKQIVGKKNTPLKTNMSPKKGLFK